MGRNASVNVKPKQSLGQNFLVDDNIARNIVQAMDLKKDDVVVEVGPGHGSLTQHLAGKVDHLVAIEIDGRVVEELKKNFRSHNVVIEHNDFLDIDLLQLSKTYGRKLRIVGNLPYHLTSPIIFKIFDEHDAVRDAMVMIQKEVAQRFVAKPRTKEYGILAVCAQFYGIPKMMFSVSPNCFYPKPKVTSAIMRIALHDTLPDRVNEKTFRDIVRATFGKRRKTLRNSLQFLPYDEETIKQVLTIPSIPWQARPEELSTDQFVGITNSIEKIVTR